MTKKILYLIEQPLSQRNFDRFGIQNWLERGWNVEIWDLTPWAHPDVWRRNGSEGIRSIEYAGYVPLASAQDFEEKMRSLNGITHFIDLAGENFPVLKVRRRLIRTGAIRVICATGSIPDPNEGKKKAFIPRLVAKLRTGPLHPGKLIGSVVWSRLTAKYASPGLHVISGTKSMPDGVPEDRIIRAHNLDYDNFLKLAATSAAVPAGEYAVFIDQDYCYHIEFLYQGRGQFVTPGKYFPAVRRCLAVIASALDVEVRIAAHPRAQYLQRGDKVFGEFPIEFGRTAQLVQGARAVICHDSTAIQYAVLFEKPLIFVTTNELNAAYEGASIAKVAAELGKRAINLDENIEGIDWHVEMMVDAMRYRTYRNKYIKIDGSPELPSWEIVIDHVSRLDEAQPRADEPVIAYGSR